MTLWLFACMPDDWTGVPWARSDTAAPTGAASPLAGACHSEGGDVSDLLAGEPFRYVAVDAAFGADGTYEVVATDADGALWPVAGTYIAGEGAPATVLVTQTEPYDATAEGIWQVDGTVLSWEVVQTVPDYGFTPPTPESGFGSSAGGGTGARRQPSTVPPPVILAASAAWAAPPPQDPAEVGLQALALFQVRTSATDLVSSNPLLDGQVVGVIGGSSGIDVDPAATAVGTEQRAGLFATYAPRVLDGRAALHSAFEIDFAWGDAANGVGGNTGGGFGGDQVNLQTRRLSASLRGQQAAAHGRVEVGLQWLGDGAADPSQTRPDALFRQGARGLLFASEAAGIAAYGHHSDAWGRRARGRVGWFTLAEQGFTQPDDVWLAVLDGAWSPGWRSELSLHAAYLQDRSGGTGGALGIGPTSPLSALMGGPDLDLYDGHPVPPDARADADLVWLYGSTGQNAALDRGDVGLHAVAGALLGRLYAPLPHDDGVAGWFGDAELRWRWTRGNGSVVALEVLATSADDADPDRYTGMITGNSYGIVGALWSTHGTSLLFPDPGAISRSTSVVPDVSNGGEGLRAAATSIGWDAVPNKVTARAGLGAATAADTTWLGTELNGGLTARSLMGASLGLRAAAVLPGPALDAMPWGVFLTFDLLVLP